MIGPYDGYTYDVEAGATTVEHRAESGEVFLIVSHLTGSDGMLARLTPKEARRLATSLLCDVALIEDGSG